MADQKWKCCNCGEFGIGDGKDKPCDCWTNNCFRMVGAGGSEIQTWSPQEKSMPNPDLSSERMAFEAWMKIRWPDADYSLLADGRYSWSITEYYWQGWLARSAIPIEVSEGMVEAGCRAWMEHLLSPTAWDHERPDRKAAARVTMRLCLTAALTVSSEVKDG